MTVFHMDIYSNYLFKLNLLIFKFVPCIIITFTLPLNYIICLTIFLFSLFVNIVYHGRLIEQISLPSACQESHVYYVTEIFIIASLRGELTQYQTISDLQR